MAETQRGQNGPPAGGMPPPPPPVHPLESVAAAREAIASATADVEATMQRASSFPDDDRHRRMNDEWSTVQSLRHIVLVIDLWLSRVILGQEDPFHPIALPPTFMPPKLPGSSIDPDAQPSFDEACEVLRGRMATLDAYLDGLTQEELERPIKTHAGTVGGGLDVLVTELRAHNSFINRDLDLIEYERTA